MLRRFLIAATGLALAAIAWWLWPHAEPHTLATIPAAPVRVTADAAPPPPPAIASHAFSVETRLLPHEGTGAIPASVRIGLGMVPPDQTRAYERWVRSGEGGAGPAQYSDLAQTEHWLTPPTQAQDDRTVVVGPAGLPAADRYDLRASSTNPLVFYSASFTSHAPPKAIAPTLAAGLTILRVPQSGADVRISFRRAEDSPEAGRWQSLLSEQAPDLLAAFDDESLTLEPTTHIAPLPPGPLDLVVLVNGVEAERQRVHLVGAAWTTVRFDEVNQAVARAVAADLELTFVVGDSTDPIEGITATWHAERGDRRGISDAFGSVQFAGVDVQRLQRFTLQFPTTPGDLPIWPETRPLELALDDEVDAASPRAIIRKTIEIAPLRWLELRTGDFPVPVHHQGGNPYPIFVLQQEREGQWADVASDHFVPILGGLAVSLQAEGRYRVMALRAPWSVRYSSIAAVGPGAADARFPVDLLPSNGRRVEIAVQRDDLPVASTPISLRGPARGLPGATVMTNAMGRLMLDEATVPDIRLEVPGYLEERVDLQSAAPMVNLRVDAEARLIP